MYSPNQSKEKTLFDGSFEDGGLSNCGVVNDSINQWIAGTATAYEGTHSGYISNDGSNNTYTGNIAQVSHIYFNVKFSILETPHQEVLDSDLDLVKEINPECLGYKLGIRELSFSGPYWPVGIGEEISGDGVTFDRINSLEDHFRGILRNLEGVSEDLTKRMYLDEGAASLSTSGREMLCPVESYTKEIEYAERLKKDSELVLSALSEE